MNVSYPNRAIVGDRRLGDRIRRSAREWSSVALGTLTAAQSIVAYGTKTFGIYVPGGVPIDTLGIDPVVDVRMLPWNDGAGQVVFFQWNPGTQRLMVSDATGTEMPAATDLSNIVVQPYTVVGGLSSPAGDSVATGPGWRCVGAAYLLAAELEVGEALDASTSDYWTVGLRRIRGDSALSPPIAGEVLAEFSTQRRLLEAVKPRRIYTNLNGLRIGNNDRLTATAVAVGTPAPLRDAVLWLYHRRLAG